MADKISGIDKARHKKPEKKVWTLEEIKKRAEEERAAYEKLAENEPDNLVSGGDMKKILEESEDEEDDSK